MRTWSCQQSSSSAEPLWMCQQSFNDSQNRQTDRQTQTDRQIDRQTHRPFAWMCRLTHVACALQEEEQCRLRLCLRKAWPSASTAPQAWLSSLRTSLTSLSLEMTRSAYPSTPARCMPACICSGLVCKLCTLHQNFVTLRYCLVTLHCYLLLPP